jgi:hypothetical protein
MESHHATIIKRLPHLATLIGGKLAFSLAECEVLCMRSRATLYRAAASGRLRMAGRNTVMAEDLEAYLRAERDTFERA